MVGATHAPGSAFRRMTTSFSILYGSMVGATMFEVGCSLSSTNFQYPLRIDGRCNLQDHGQAWQELYFQYPLRIDGRCNGLHIPLVWSQHYTFSILYGSMVGATFVPGTTYPGEVELSVSSTDRWSVQRLCWRGWRRSEDTFSILYGSMVGATQKALKWISSAHRTFSILYGSMVGATTGRGDC